ncbi:MAG: DUF4974 domain-containing protein [Prevotella sp.]|nr:DUF4974 domain-containing protein [Prevotella sp.]
MKDIEQLLRMTEHPQDYTDEELQQIMSNPDMRAYYELMVSAEAGFAMKKNKATTTTTRSKFYAIGNRFVKIAAMFIGILFITGIGYAAYHLAVGGNVPANEDVKAPTQETCTTESNQQEVQDVIRTFENVELQQILQELSDYYHVDVEFRNEQVRHIRLYTKWDTTAPLKQMIERLNGFEKVNVRLNDSQINAE